MRSANAVCTSDRQEWLKRSSSCPSCRTDVLNPRWVRVRIVDELLELFPPGEGADLPSAVSEATGDVVHPGSCGNCHAVLRASGGEACGVCGMDLGLCRRCAAATSMQCEECALKAANEQLSRAEDLADASGYKAAAALAQASRGHLCALAADWIVDAVRRGAHDPSEQADVIQSLLEEEEEEEELSLSDGQGVMLLVGRLGDQAVAETYAAMRSIDSVVEPDAATVLALMTSGALQAAVDRLRLLPPPDVSEEQRRQVVLDMLGQAVQLLPGEGQFPSRVLEVQLDTSGASAASTVGACVDRQCAMLSAQAHLALSKVHAGLETSSLACHDRQSRQPHKTAPWHLDRVRSALHRASEPVRLEDQTVVTAMLIQVHLLHASFISLGHVPTKKRQHERSLEELLAASRLAASEDGASGVAGDCMLPLRLKTVWKKIKTLVLDQVRHVLRLLCTGKPSSSNEGWKSLYRFALKLEPHQLSELVSAYDKTPI
ncbi:hypothetical protein AK812_SmicGene20525 [Symbiodinium microadriaticum]|uniref:Uncharacterized protein n=1 Tax=Symbiodinium microadriaticum TaxID=2951 RepID=A0A1Q9DPS4_SYMMI|nr:hypothetical protein AK812_SmicGene20525 [Symbiodinium microadriaticum]